jgi:phospholipase A1
VLAASVVCSNAIADSAQIEEDACLINQLNDAPDDITVGELRARCATNGEDSGRSLILDRREREQAQESLGAVLTGYKQNYLMPVTYVTSPNTDPYPTVQEGALSAESLSPVEAKFQISLKFKLANNVLLPDDTWFFGFTSLSFWQAYNTDISAAFRETNYEPELFWSAPIDWHPFDIDATVLGFGFSHQSNGRGGSLSRSWNRLYANLSWEKYNFLFNLKPWWRIPEDEKTDPLDNTGDDNPDIEDYMGHFEFTTAYKHHEQEFTLLLRNNLRSDNKGAVQLEWMFPLWGNLRGYAQYFNGYGESLIDYDASIQRFGIGFLLTSGL